MTPLVVVDADVLGRQRTGDETYVENLLREFSLLEHGLRLAAVTRRPELVPRGIAPLELRARSQPWRMALSLPRLLRRIQPSLAHFLYVVPPAYRSTAVLTVQDLSFEREPQLMSPRDLFYFRTFVPRSARRAARVLTGSERTRADLVERYRLPPERVVVTRYGYDPIYGPDGPAATNGEYALFVGGLEPRKDPVAVLEALALVNGDLRLILAGPARRAAEEVQETIRRLGLEQRVELRGHVAKEELAALYRGARCLVFPSRYEGFGLPVIEAMASGTPVVATAAGAIPEVAGDAAVLVEPGDTEALAAGIEQALAERERLRAAGLERARSFNWAVTARQTLDVYRELL